MQAGPPALVWGSQGEGGEEGEGYRTECWAASSQQGLHPHSCQALRSAPTTLRRDAHTKAHTETRTPDRAERTPGPEGHTHLDAAVARKGHLQQRGGNASIADVVACQDAPLKQQRLSGLKRQAQLGGGDVGGGVANLEAAGEGEGNGVRQTAMWQSVVSWSWKWERGSGAGKAQTIPFLGSMLPNLQADVGKQC